MNFYINQSRIQKHACYWSMLAEPWPNKNEYEGVDPGADVAD